MEILIIWGTTIIATFIMNLSTNNMILKGIADEGYKIKMDSIKELRNNMNVSTNTLILFVPIVNMLSALNDNIKIRNAYPYILETCKVFDIVEEMNEKEKEYYDKKPTGMRASLLTAGILDLKDEVEKTKKEQERIKNEKDKIYIFQSYEHHDDYIRYQITPDLENLIIIEKSGIFKEYDDNTLVDWISKTLIDLILATYRSAKENGNAREELLDKFSRNQIDYVSNYTERKTREKKLNDIEVVDKPKVLNKIKKS